MINYYLQVISLNSLKNSFNKSALAYSGFLASPYYLSIYSSFTHLSKNNFANYSDFSNCVKSRAFLIFSLVSRFLKESLAFIFSIFNYANAIYLLRHF